MSNYMFWNSYGCECKDALELWYYITLEQILTSMFNYNNLPKGLNRKYIEHCLIRFGCAGIVKVNDDYFVGIPAITPPLDNYGIGTKIIVTTFNGQHQITGTIGKDCVLIWNNSEFVNDYIISWFAKMFKEIDKSMESNVYNSRLHPIPIAKNSKIKSAIDNIFKTIKGENVKNETYSVLSEQAFEDVISGKSTPVDVINLTDVNNIDKIQTELATFSARKSKNTQIDNIEIVPGEFLILKQSFQPDKIAIKKAIEAGREVAGVSVVENVSLQIK